jgi:hypothetical protein
MAKWGTPNHKFPSSSTLTLSNALPMLMRYKKITNFTIFSLYVCTVKKKTILCSCIFDVVTATGLLHWPHMECNIRCSARHCLGGGRWRGSFRPRSDLPTCRATKLFSTERSKIPTSPPTLDTTKTYLKKFNSN